MKFLQEQAPAAPTGIDWVDVVIALIAFVAAGIAWQANRIAKAAKQEAVRANELAKEANDHADHANGLAKEQDARAKEGHDVQWHANFLRGVEMIHFTKTGLDEAHQVRVTARVSDDPTIVEQREVVAPDGEIIPIYLDAYMRRRQVHLRADPSESQPYHELCFIRVDWRTPLGSPRWESHVVNLPQGIVSDVRRG